MSEPTRVIAGDTWGWTRQESTYSPSAGWSLKYVLVMQGQTPVQVTTTGLTDTYTAAQTAAQTAVIVAGTWKWTAIVTKAAERYSIDSGVLQVDPDPSQMTAATDTRTVAEQAVATITAALLKSAGDGLIEYEIDGFKAKTG